MERLFRAYFTEGADVADHATLVGLAGGGRPGRRAAAGGPGRRTTSPTRCGPTRPGPRPGHHGVPAFVVDDRLLIPGAQDVDTILRVLVRARERSTARRPALRLPRRPRPGRPG